jgi:peroxiredoxin
VFKELKRLKVSLLNTLNPFNTLNILNCFLICMSLLGFSGESLIGTSAPVWSNDRWINSSPLQLSQLKGKAIFLRFFMDSTCPFCRASAPYLNEFHDTYKDRGLIVIGMYTPKPRPRTTDARIVQQYVKDYGFSFPVAVDDDWATLKRFWLDRVPNAEYTSVSFLIDKKGLIRYIHPGGTYSKDDVVAIKKKIEEVILEQ